MNNKSDVEKALDDIFGDEFLEVDTKDTPKDDKDIIVDDLPKENSTKYLDSTPIKNNVFDFDNEVNDNIKKIDIDELINVENIKENKSEISKETNKLLDNKNEESIIDTSKEEKDNIETIVNNAKSFSGNNKSDKGVKTKKRLDNILKPYIKKNFKIILICSIILGIILISIFTAMLINKERVINCSYEATDEGYKTTDEYIISHKGNNLTYISGTYIYTAFNEEYKKQIDYIKDDKLPVIINSNGMPGFTHVYEIGEGNIKIYSYYDITKMNFKIVDKNNDKITPLSYLNIKSTTNLKKLKSKLEKEGYKCARSH